MNKQLNFEIDNVDNIALTKDNIANKLDDYYEACIYSAYKNYIENNQFSECLELYKLSKVKYLVNDKKLLKTLISKVYALQLYTLDLNWIDTSKITDMSELFINMHDFNGNISEWDTSNVEYMEDMFCWAVSFNQPIGNWDVSNVECMEDMFWQAKSFNQPIGNWNTGNVKDMDSMFWYAESFNQPIGDWNVSKVKNMLHMFANAKKFNLDISNWNVKKVKTAHNIFNNNCPIKEEYKPKFK